MKTAKVRINVMVSFGGQFIVLLLGIFLPRIMIVNYGSDTNGLISTVAQIFTYMALLEAGIGQAAKNALYKPIAEQKRDEVSHVASIASQYYRRVTVYYSLGVLMLSIFVPFLVKSNVDKMTIFGIVILEGLSGVCSFYFIQTPSTILLADGKGYINNLIVYGNKILAYAVKLIMAAFGINIVLMYLVFFLITVAKVFIYQRYFWKHYPWIELHRVAKGEKLRDRNSYVLTELAWTVFSSTDMIILSIFIGTELSSVYGVYNLVFSNLNVLLTAVYASVSYVLGITFFKSISEYKKVHDAFMTVFMAAVTILMCVAYIMVLPFIRLYTRGVTDVEYIYQQLPLLFCLVQMLSWSRYVSGNLTGIAGYAKQTSIISLIEATSNIVLSIFLVNNYGIQGVLFATVISLPLKVVYCNYIADKKVLKRSFWQTIKILGINYILYFAVVLIYPYICWPISGYLDFCIYSVITLIIVSAVVILTNFIINPQAYRIMIKFRESR